MSLYDKFYQLAKSAKFSFPSGRAWYLVGRHYNTGCYSISDDYHVRIMGNMREETARRWDKHYKKGGSAKCLGRTITQENKRRGQYRAQRKFDQQVLAAKYPMEC